MKINFFFFTLFIYCLEKIKVQNIIKQNYNVIGIYKIINLLNNNYLSIENNSITLLLNKNSYFRLNRN